MPVSAGYPLSQIVNVTVNLSPVAAASRNFGATLAIGASAVIDTVERIRQYADLASVGQDFGAQTPEYLAATAFFSQSPKPSLLYIGRWAQGATAGQLNGGALSKAAQALATFTAVNAGKLTVTVDGVAKAMAAIDFSAQTNLNGVAGVITTKLAGAATCVWDAPRNRFQIISATTGVASTLTFPAVVGADQNVSAIMGLNAVNGASVVAGGLAETLAAAVQALADISSAWYFVGVAAVAADALMPSMAALVEAMSPVRFAGFTTADPNALVTANTTDLASVLKAANYERSFVQYSSANAYAVFSVFGRGATIDFNGAQTEITYKFKQEPGITAETLTTSQYASLKGKNCNVFINLNNGVAILQEGVTAAGFYIDEVQGTDWLSNDLQSTLFAALYGTNKIPQTDAGVNQLVTAAAGRLAQAVNNGLCAPGTWAAPGFGALNTGDTLPQGFYIYAPPVATQSAQDRAARIAPTLTIAAKLAGAIHFVAAVVVTNR